MTVCLVFFFWHVFYTSWTCGLLESLSWQFWSWLFLDLTVFFFTSWCHVLQRCLLQLMPKWNLIWKLQWLAREATILITLKPKKGREKLNLAIFHWGDEIEPWDTVLLAQFSNATLQSESGMSPFRVLSWKLARLYSQSSSEDREESARPELRGNIGISPANCIVAY